MATINVTTSQNLSAVTYAQDDIINVLDGVTLTINSQWSISPRLIQALGTGRIEASNTSTTTPHLQQFFLQQGTNSAGILVQQNAVFQVRGDWIVVGTSTGANNQVLFSANNIGGVAIDYPTMIQVETGNGTNVWEIWNAIPEDVAGGTVNALGFNAPNITAGTVAVTAGGVVTGTGTNFLTTQVGLPFKLPGIARDFVVSAFTSTTSITIQELNGTTYTGGVVAAGSSYILRAGSLIAPSQVGSDDIGKVLFFNPLTTAVRMGDGTNGTKIPTGARVRVPNIHFNSALQQTTLATAISGTGAQAFTLAAAIGPTANGTFGANLAIGTLLLINGSNVERIFYSTRAGAVISATGMARGAAGTTAQASFPIGTTVYWIPTNNTTNNATINASPSGAVDIQICSMDLRMVTGFSAFASLTIRDLGYAYLFNAGNCSGPFDIEGLSGLGIGYQHPNINGGISAQFSALLGIGSIANVSVTNNLPGGANSYANIAVGNVQGLTAMSNLRSRHWGRTTNAGGGALQGVGFTTVKSTTPVTGVYAAGSSVRWNALDNLDTAEIFVSALPNANTCGSGDTFIPVFAQGITDSTIRGMQLWGGGRSYRQALITVDSGSADVVFHNKGYPAFDGGLQLGSIISDLGLDTIVTHISISNPRIGNNASVLPNTMAFNRGGFHRMLLIDSITATTSGSGANSKGGLGLDVIAGPHRAFNNTAGSAIIPNLADVQPIVVLSNVAKTVGSVYVGGFSSQSAFDMYAFTGGTYLDNLGRIYYPGIGDSAIIKSVFPLRGITNFAGTAFDFNYNLVPGSNTVPAGTTFEFRMVNWGAANTGAWTEFVDNASLETARAALTGYSSSVGIDLQLRVTGTTAVAGRYLMSAKFPVTIDAAYDPAVYNTELGFSGAQAGTLIAGYDNTAPSTPVLRASKVAAGASTTVPMPYNYDAIPVAYRLVARKPGWTFSSLTGTYLKTAITIPITQTQVVDVNGTPIYLDAVTGVAVDHGAATITVSASRSAAQVWSAVQDNLSELANATRADPFTTNNGSSFASAYTLIVSGALTSGNVTGNVTLSGTLSSGVAITGNVSQAVPTNLSGVTIIGNLTFNTNSPITITLTDCAISGTVSNSGTGAVTISRLRSTIGTVGANVTTRPVTSLNLTGLTAGSQIYVADGVGAEVAYVASSGTSYTLDTTGQTGTWFYKVARYGFTAETGTHSPAVASTSAAVTLAADLFITQATKATVAAYEVLQNLDRLYDYAALYETTNGGIRYPRIITKAGTSASAGSYPVTINDVGDLFVFDGSALSIWTDYRLEPGATITGALFTTGVVTIPQSFNDASILANVSQPEPGDLNNVDVTGNLTYDTSAPFGINVTLTDCTISGTVSNSGTADVVITKVNTTLGALGTRVTAQQFATISAPNLLAGTRVRVLNTTNNLEMFNGVLEEAGFLESFIFTANKNITLTATYVSGATAKLGVSASGIFTANGATFLNSQENDTVYNGYAINGSAVTGFAADYAQDDVNLTVSTSFTAASLYAWWVYNTTTEQGIREFFGGITALDAANLRINTATVSVYLDNSTASFIYQTDAIRIFRTDNAYPARTVTTGGGGISVNWISNVFVTGVDLTSLAKEASMNLVKAKTDNLPADTAAAIAAIPTTPAPTAAAVAAAVDASAVLAKEASLTDVNNGVSGIASSLATKPTLAQIEASTVLAKQASLSIVNNGVKKASKLIPHTTDL